MKGITKKLRGLVFCLAFLTALTVAGRVEAQAADGTINMTIERFSIGGGFIMEPKVVKIKSGDTYATLIQRVLKEDLKRDYTYTGDNSDFYLAGIAGYDMNPQFPDCVQDILTDYRIYHVTADTTPGYLTEHDYTIGTGWMYYVNDKWVNGMSVEYPQNGDVCRLMYTAFYGLDIAGEPDPNMDTPGIDLHSKTYYKVAKKQDLVRKMAAMNEDKSSWSSNANMVSAYNHAVDVMAAFDASQNDVTEALAMLNGSGSGSGGNTGSLSLSLDKTSLSLKPGELGSIGYTVSPDSTPVTWTSSNTGVASVEGLTNDAIVTAKAKGTATITATAVSGGQTKTASCTVTVTDDGAALDVDFEKGAPKVSVTKKSASSVTISWEVYSGAESYNILRRKSGESFKVIKKGVTGTSYTDTAVKANTTYYYSVEAVKGSQKSKTDTNCMVKTPKAGSEKPAKAKAPAKTTLQSVTAKKKQAVLKWKKTARAEGYEVRRATKKNGSYTVVKTIKKAGTLTYTDKKLKSKNIYYYKVRAYRKVSGKKIYSAYSEPVSVQIP